MTRGRLPRSSRPQLVKLFERRPTRVGCRLDHYRRNCADQHGLRDPRRAVTADVTGDFTAARGVADMDGRS